jgi:hypothetical protein
MVQTKNKTRRGIRALVPENDIDPEARFEGPRFERDCVSSSRPALTVLAELRAARKRSHWMEPRLPSSWLGAVLPSVTCAPIGPLRQASIIAAIGSGARQLPAPRRWRPIGFVPRRAAPGSPRCASSKAGNRHLAPGRDPEPENSLFTGGPRVRIHLPPAVSLQNSKVPGPPATQDHVPKQQCQDRGQQRRCRVQDRVQLGVILVTALKQYAGDHAEAVSTPKLDDFS